MGDSTRISLLTCAALALLVGAFAAPAGASSAPEYVSSEPENGEQLHKAPDRVEITFSEPLDPSSSGMRVLDECGGVVDDGDVDITVNEMSVGIADKPAGTYTVRYSATGPAGLTGSTKGTFSFAVHLGPACAGESEHDHHGDAGHDHSGNHDANHDANHEGHEGHEGGHEDHGTGDHGDHHTLAAGGGAGHAHSPSHDDHGGASAKKGAPLAKSNDGSNDRVLALDSGPSVPGVTTAVVALLAAVLLGGAGGLVLRVSERR
jgi:methionine-rich copper-binding protein CopC